MNNIASGAGYLVAGFQLITKPGLKRFVVIPLLINIILFAGLLLGIGHFMREFNDWFASFLPTWLQWLKLVLWLLFFVSFFLFVIFAFVTVANLIAAPFNSLLAEKVELYLAKKPLEQRSIIESLKDIPRIVSRQLAILAYYVPRAFILFILFFIPVVQAVATVMWILFNAWLMALTYFDYPTDNHRVSFHDVRLWLEDRRLVALGFGVSVLVVSMIPIINLFVIPAAVAGATKCWLEEGRLNKKIQ